MTPRADGALRRRGVALLVASTMMVTAGGDAGCSSVDGASPLMSSAGSDPAGAGGEPTPAYVGPGAPPSSTAFAPSAPADVDADAGAPKEPVEPLCVLTGPPPTRPDDPDVLVFSDEFDGELDPLRWSVGAGDKSHGTIVNTVTPANVAVKGGALEIATDRNDAGGPRPYVSGWVDTYGRFARTYGRIEFRARFPAATGVWYALWGRPWSQPFPEIDVEVINRPGAPTSDVYFVNHWAAPPIPADERRSYVTLRKDVSAFHDYAVVWAPGSIEWSMDGAPKMTARPEGVPDLPVYWTINGWVGGWSGSPTEATPFPTTFAVDHVRVYRVGGLLAAPALFVRPRASRTYGQREAVEVWAANFDEACVHVTMRDGERIVRTTSTAPYRFPLAALARGAHRLVFEATDGERVTTFTLDANIE